MMKDAFASMLPWIEGYRALTGRTALVRLGPRTQIELSGADRAAFLHNLCTADIRKLPAGSGCEAFLTTVQARILAHVLVFAGAESIVLSAVPGLAESITTHLDHYLVSERVTITDRTDDWSEIYLGGPEAEAQLARACGVELPASRLGHVPAMLADRLVWIRRVDLTWPDGYIVASAGEHADEVQRAIESPGAVVAPPEAFEAARIEHGFPLFGRDISDRNLPQEIGRDALAISFTKGCYLGQETVARIDALGHVNQKLVALSFAGPAIPAPAASLVAAGQVVGQVTSATFSPHYGAPLALGYVRRGHNAVGTHLQSEFGDAEIVVLDHGQTLC